MRQLLVRSTFSAILGLGLLTSCDSDSTAPEVSVEAGDSIANLIAALPSSLKATDSILVVEENKTITVVSSSSITTEGATYSYVYTKTGSGWSMVVEVTSITANDVEVAFNTVLAGNSAAAQAAKAAIDGSSSLTESEAIALINEINGHLPAEVVFYDADFDLYFESKTTFTCDLTAGSSSTAPQTFLSGNTTFTYEGLEFEAVNNGGVYTAILGTNPTTTQDTGEDLILSVTVNP